MQNLFLLNIESQSLTCFNAPNGLLIVQIKKWQCFHGLVHGFTTRAGGISTGNFSSLNFGASVGDDPVCVQGNRRKIAQATRTFENQWLTVKQIHGDRIIDVHGENRAKEILANRPEADALALDAGGYVAAVKTADCVPLLLVCAKKRVAAAIHAGWRGTALEIARKSVLSIVSAFDLLPEEIFSAVGPCIGPCCYEVNQDVAEAVGKACVREKGGKWFADLGKANTLQLRAAGIPEKNICRVDLCTACNKNLFFSHRRDRGITGRMIAFVGWMQARSKPLAGN